MAVTRQDAWSEDDDLLLAEVTLRHIREGSTQLAAFEEVGLRLNRTPAACGFRWNSLVRKRYETAIQIAKAQRQQLKSKGKSRLLVNRGGELSYSTKTGNDQSDYLTEFALDKKGIEDAHRSAQSMERNITFDDVIRFLRVQKDSFKNSSKLNRQLEEKEEEIKQLREENEKLKKELDEIRSEYNIMNEDYQALMKIMERARKLAFMADDDEPKVSFRMDKNGNLERVEK